MKQLCIAALVAVAVSGCSSTSNEKADIQEQFNKTDNVPEWVFSPAEENGLASATCVPWSGNMQIDKSQAVTAARADLAQQIELRVSVMDKNYARKSDTTAGIETAGTFENVVKTVTAQRLNGAMAKHVSFATIDSAKQLCALVTMNPTKTQELFDALLISAKADVDPQSKAAMFEEFKAQKAQQELEAELQRLNL
ncbi:hypothetical protein [Ferrimonas lipolytica]|uniref:LPP20 lipoprotein n=1 Tax=Ferrimonas lipolytica TaxID=2724191 RepID=A0A6H1UJ97_9GAMM|nr:hypothetical protein [Ferrimonas lipolytica]QIZ78383.1 hypothetical protein HER31_16625 [Ferrimonas lipolytica]